MALLPSSILRRAALFLLAGSLTGLLLTGCHQVVKDPADPHFIVAESKTWTIERADLNHEIGSLLGQHQKTIQDVDPAKRPMLETQVLKNMVMKKLMLEKAASLQLTDVDKADADAYNQLKGNFPTDAEFDAKLKSMNLTRDEVKREIHENTVIRKALDQTAFKGIAPTDAEISSFYMQNQDKLTTPEKVRLTRVLIMVDDKTTPKDLAAKRKAIDKAHTRVAKGEDIAKVAGEVSEDKYSKGKGGDLGYTSRGENEAGFDEVAFNTKPGQLSAVFQTPMGLQFLKVTDVHPGGVVPLAQARETIAHYLLQAKQRQAFDAYTQKLMADNNVVYHLKLVDPSQLPGAQGPAGAPPTASPGAPSATSAPAPPPATNAGP